MKVISIFALITLFATPCLAAGEYKDVPKDHWAAEAVAAVTSEGIMSGYPNNEFKGDKPVTRYELAVALQAMIEYIQQSEKPITTPATADDSKAQTQTDPKAGELKTAQKVHWAEASIEFLRKGQFLAKDSTIVKGGEKPITQKELADSLAAVAAKLIELRVPPVGTPD